MKTRLIRVAGRTSLLYAFFAALWILLSDQVLTALWSDPKTIGMIAMYKGWGFVTVTALLLYTTLRGQLQRWEEEANRRKQAEDEREVAVSFLRLINENRTLNDAVRTTVDFFREQSGCEAVGIRLKEGEDYPYFETHGFPPEFVLAEKRLCARDTAGQVVRDSIGNPVMECMCGNVICGRFDPSKPFFTAHGSFWTNSTTELLASTTEEDRQARTRNRCNGEGYESVALIPLSLGNERLGLLQLNDRQADRFSEESVALWERLAGYLAVALAKFQAEKALRESEKRYRLLAENVSDVIWIFDTETFRIGYVSPSVERLRGYAAEELMGKAVAETVTPTSMEHVRRVLPERLSEFRRGIVNSYVDEIEQPHRNGSTVWTETITRFVVDDETGLLEVYGVSRDITERRRTEKELRDSLDEKVVLLKEVHHRVKNNLQIVASLLNLQASRSQNRQVIDVLEDTGSRVRSMALLHETLYRSGNLARINFAGYARDLCAQLLRSFGPASARVKVENLVTPIELPLEQALPCGLIINELLSNALKHGFPNNRAGIVTIELGPVGGGKLALLVRDNGVGLPPGMDLALGATLGLRLVANLAIQIGGRLEVESPDGGAAFTVVFPSPESAPSGGRL